MTSNRNPDRLIRAWLELMPDEAPDRTIANVLQAIESTPQVRRPLAPALRRFSPMNRLTYAAAAAAIIAVLAGGALLLRPSSNTGGPPPPSPSATPVVLPAELRATWLAAAGPTASPGSIIRLVVTFASDRMSIVEGGGETLVSQPVAGREFELTLMSIGTAGGCQIGDIGRYRWVFAADGTVPGSDGTQMGMTVIEDDCTARTQAFQRPWFHALDANSKGGRGVIAAFSPMFLVTLPAASYVATSGTDYASVTSKTPDRTLIAVKNPVGWTDPCSATGGAKRPIEPTIAAFTTYMRTLPGFTVQSSDLTIDGHRAVLLTIPSTQTADCQGHRVSEWTAGAGDGSGGWLLNQGDTDIVYLVEVGTNLILLQWLGDGVTTAEEQALFATIHFTDTLPPTP